MIILLDGDLGAGKTQLAKGIAKGLNIKDIVASPTYTILCIYSGDKDLHHFDLYRISDEDDFFEIGGYEYLVGKGVSVIEWAQRIKWDEFNRLEVSINIIDNNTRKIKMIPYGDKYENWLDNL